MQYTCSKCPKAFPRVETIKRFGASRSREKFVLQLGSGIFCKESGCNKDLKQTDPNFPTDELIREMIG